MKSYITTPIFYVNATPHLGHAYSSIVADTYNRFRKIDGCDGRFQTGTDEHGDKIAEAAAQNGLSPKEYADKISAQFQESWPPLRVEPDNFIRTTNREHIATVQAVLQRIYDQGDIVFSDYTGLYCTGCERFLTEKELVDGKCPDHQREPEEIKEKNYFFKMGRYQDWLVEHIKKNPDFITPKRYRNEVLALLKEPLDDLCISRPTSRLTWGIPLPFDENFVTYVWFDALINYLSGLGYDGRDPAAQGLVDFWPVAEHVIAKDILKPHAIFWPTMLRAMGLSPYKRLHVHGYWNVDDTKMSKSLGNVVRPLELVEEFGVDSLRYFLLREMSFGLDSSFSLEALKRRHNSDLANDLGNLFSRTMAMVKKFSAGVVPKPLDIPEDIDLLFQENTGNMLRLYREEMENFQFNKALGALWDVIGAANRYIVENAPWELAKDPDKRERLDGVIYNLLETLRLVAIPLQAIMPDTAAKMLQVLVKSGDVVSWDMADWGVALEVGGALSFKGSLFPRLEKAKEKAAPKKESAKKKGATKKGKGKAASSGEGVGEGLVEFSDFGRLDIRVATIKAAEKIKKSDRLLKLTVEAPEERTIVAGIAEYYAPEDIVGWQVLIVANLKPVKLMGVESQGMVMAAKSGSKLVLSGVSAEVEAGSKVS